VADHVRVNGVGVVDREDRVTRFTEIELHLTIGVPLETDVALVERSVPAVAGQIHAIATCRIGAAGQYDARDGGRSRPLGTPGQGHRDQGRDGVRADARPVHHRTQGHGAEEAYHQYGDG
jgi:hypothetical protein